MTTKSNSAYDASQITVLKDLEPVRKRPGMYIGSTGSRGLHHLVWEVVDNSIDEAMAGYCTRIDVTILESGGVRVVDNGRGISESKGPHHGLDQTPVESSKPVPTRSPEDFTAWESPWSMRSRRSWKARSVGTERCGPRSSHAAGWSAR